MVEQVSRAGCTVSLTLVFMLLSGCAADDSPLEFGGPYFGQEPPGAEPELFMPGLVSTNYADHCIGFLDGGRSCVFSIWEKGTFFVHEEDGMWTRPEQVPWQNERGATDFMVAPDGHTVVFQSARSTSSDDEKRESNTWKVEWTGTGWSEAVPLPPPANTVEYHELYPSVAPDGALYFFSLARPDTRIGDIYRSRFVDGEYLEAERLPFPINSDYYEVDPVVAPDGRYLLFGSGRPGGHSLLDLYISFRGGDGGWTAPVNAGPELNPLCIPTRMSVTPDGKYFFFPSSRDTEVLKGEDVVSDHVKRWGDYDVYWVDTSFVGDLRARHHGKKSAAAVVEQEYHERGILSAAMLLDELYRDRQDSLYFELSEFMIFYADLLTAGRGEESQRIYEAVLQTFPDEIRVTQGFAVTCLLNGRVPRGLDLMKDLWTRFPTEIPEDMFMVAFQLRRKSRLDDELAVLRFLAREFPDSAFAHLDLAAAHEHYGNTKEALESCAKALELDPALVDAVKMKERLKSTESESAGLD